MPQEEEEAVKEEEKTEETARASKPPNGYEKFQWQSNASNATSCGILNSPSASSSTSSHAAF